MAHAAKPAIVLLSGGLDSTTCLAIAKAEGFACHALSFDYGQRHRQELRAARAIAKDFQVHQHLVLQCDLSTIGGSALTANLAVPKDRDMKEMTQGIPITYVPARNTIFLSYALAWAEVIRCVDIFIGVNVLDYSGYPDCRPDFIRAFEELANRATRLGTEDSSSFRVHTPLIALNKAQIIRRAASLGIDFSLTHSCYDPVENGDACGRCDACLLRAKGFVEAGISDPLTQNVS